MGYRVCASVLKILSWTDAAGLSRHGRRHGRVRTRVETEASKLNRHIVVGVCEKPSLVKDPPEIGALLRARAEAVGARFRKNGAVGTELLITIGDEFFSKGAPDVKRSGRIMAALMSASIKRWGNAVVAGRLDRDETVPHFSVFLLPYYEKIHDGPARRSSKPTVSVSHNKFFGGPKELSELQDWSAGVIRSIGYDVVRGHKGHVSEAQIHGVKEAREAIHAAHMIRNDMLEAKEMMIRKVRDLQAASNAMERPSPRLEREIKGIVDTTESLRIPEIAYTDPGPE